MRNTGFLIPTIESKHYIMGAGNVPFKVLQKDGDWTPSLPVGEPQSRENLETDNCTGFGSAKQICEYMRVAFELDFNPSERWIGIVANTRPPGNDPQSVYEAIRKNGLIPEEMLPFSDDIKTVDDYYSFKGGDEAACHAAAKKWTSEYNFMHEWVFDPAANLSAEDRLHNMRVALKYSPLAVAVYAWIADERNIYVKLGPENHWTNIYKIDDFLNIMDSYEPYLKKTDQVVVFCKRISIERRKTPLVNAFSIWEWIKNFFNKIFK